MPEIQTLTEQYPRAVAPQETSAVVGEPGIANRKSPGGTPWESDHPVNLRLTIPLFKRRYYIALVAGTERRSIERRAEGRRKHPIATTGNIAFLFAAGTVVGVALLTLVQLVGHWVLMQTGWVQL